MLWTIFIVIIILGFLIYKISNTDDKITSETEEIVFSPHAVQRMQERDIPEDFIKNIINDKNSIVSYKFGNRFSLTNGEITVVLSRQFDKLVVITVYWNKRRRKQPNDAINQ